MYMWSDYNSRMQVSRFKQVWLSGSPKQVVNIKKILVTNRVTGKKNDR